MYTVMILGLTSSINAEEIESSNVSEQPEAVENGWDVNAPPGEKVEISISTTEGTWMSVDVSPDGTQIVFDLLGDIYTIPIAGGEATAITSGMAWDMQPVFSPDGTQIAFTSDRSGGDNLWVMDSDGENAVAITDESFRLFNSPAWSPDGQYLIGRKHFTARRSLGAGEIWMVHLDGGKGLQLTSKTSDQKDLGEPAFSPDGSFVYFSKDATSGAFFEYNKDPNKQIYAIDRLDLDTGDIERVTGGPGGAIRPTPSPDGSRLAFLRRHRADTRLMVRDLDSGLEREVAAGLDHDMQETWAIHGVYPHMDWTPDSDSLVFWSGGKIKRVFLTDGRMEDIPFRVEDTREIRTAVRFPVEVSPDQFDVKLIRGATVSPNGQQVVYQALGRLWLQSTSGGQPTRLTSERVDFELDPAWSPDGLRIVYATWNDEELGGVRLFDLKRKRTTTIDVGKGHFRQPVFSPDGDSIVYKRQGGGWLHSPLWSSDQGLYRYNIATKKNQLLTSGGSSPHFLTDANQLYFHQWRDGQLTLQRLTLDSRDQVQIASSKMGSELRLSPDGKYLAFREDHNVHWTLRPTTGRDISVGTSAVPGGQLSSFAGRDVHFAADGSRVYWTVGSQLQSVDLADANEDMEPQIVELGFQEASDRHRGSYAIVGARLITMSSQGVIEQGTIVWNGHRIVAVGPTDNVQVDNKTTKVFDGTGLTIIPGLVDVHFHGSQGSGGITPQQNWKNLSSLSYGVTTVHDPSNNTEMVFAASELQKNGTILAPRIYSTGTILYGAESRAMAKVNSLDDAMEHLNRMKSVGAISVKSYNQPRRDQRQQVLEAGRQTGVMVVPEGGSLLMHNLTQIVDGHTGVEHALPVAPLYEDVLQLWSQTNVGYTPTLGVAYGGLMGEHYWYANTNVWEDERLLAFVPHKVVDAASRRATRVPQEEYHHITIAQSVRALEERGVNVQIGAHGQREGLAAHWEMWMMEQGGMSPLNVLEVATLGGARYLGLDKDLGSLEMRKLADFVVLTENPLEDLRKSKEIQWTVLNGRIYESLTMDQLYPAAQQRLPLYFKQDGVQPTQTETLECGCTNH